MSYHLLLPLATMALSLGLIGVVLTHPWRVPGRAVFVTLLLTMALWAGGQFGTNASTDAQSALLWHRMLLISATLFPALFLHFTYLYVGRKPPYPVLIAAYAAAGTGISLSLLGLTASGVEAAANGYVPKTLPLFAGIMPMFYGTGALAIINVLHAQRFGATPAARNRATYLLMATLVAMGFGSLDFAAAVGVTSYSTDTAGNFAFGLLATAPLLNDRLMDMRLAFRRVAAHTVLALLTGVLTVAAITVGSTVLTLELGTLGTAIVVIAVYTVATPVLHYRVSHIIDRAWFRTRHEPIKELQRFSEEVASILDLQVLNMTMVNVVREATSAQHVSLMQRAPRNAVLRTSAHVGTDAMLELNMGKSEALAMELGKAKTMLTIGELQATSAWQSVPKQQREKVEDAGAELLVPVSFRGRLEGLLILGPRRDGSAYTQEEGEQLFAVASQVAPSMENARLYEELRAQYEELRDTQAQLLQTGKLASLGTLATGVAHEISNPLFSILGRVEMLTAYPEEHLKSPKAVEYVGVIGEMSRRISLVVNRLVAFADREERSVPVDLNTLAIETVALVAHDLATAKIEVRQELAPELPPVTGNPAKLKQAIMNLVSNAREAMPNGGTLTLATSAAGGNATLTCSDTGRGIVEAEIPRIFDAFYTTKTKKQGVGLGLHAFKAIVDEHNGQISVDSAPGQGTSIRMALPAAAPMNPPMPIADSNGMGQTAVQEISVRR